MIARELADAGMRVAVAARSAGQVEETAQEIDGLAVTADVSKQEDVEAMVGDRRARARADRPAREQRRRRPVAARCRGRRTRRTGGTCSRSTCSAPTSAARAVLRGMVERGRGRIVNMGSGASYLPMGGGPTAYGASKAALGRFGELLAGQVAEFGIAVFTISPGLVRTEMTGALRRRRPWTPPELAPRLVRVARERARRPARRPLHPRRARRHRGADRARRRDRASAT